MFQLLFEIGGQILFELAAEFGWESVKDSARREREANPVLAAIGHFLVGLAAGVVSLLLVGRRLIAPAPIPGLSLLLSPLGTGVAMHWIGEFWVQRRKDRPALFSFRAGALFAFGMALVRFIYLELGQRP